MLDNRRTAISQTAQRRKGGGLGEVVRTVVFALLIAVGIRTIAFEPFNIPSGSMIPTLLIGDYLFVSKYSYGYSRYSLPFGLPLWSGRILSQEPKRGDVAVFKLPRDGKTDYIKRVIGLPGDRIQLKAGRLFINDEMVVREKTSDFTYSEGSMSLGRAAQYIEALPGGVKHTIIELTDAGPLDTTGVYTVPAAHYFMMGDNRDNSLDSRVPPEQGGVGFVPLENLVGRAEFLFFSIDDSASWWAPWTWPGAIRFGRLFHGVG
jgi:signal peptidase I